MNALDEDDDAPVAPGCAKTSRSCVVSLRRQSTTITDSQLLVAGLGAAFADAAGAGAGGGADGAGEGTGCGFGPPMLREMVGAGAGASVCSGRSTGWRGGGVGCCREGGMRKALPGTNSNAPALSLLIVVNEGGDGVQDTNIFDLLKQDPSPTPM